VEGSTTRSSTTYIISRPEVEVRVVGMSARVSARNRQVMGTRKESHGRSRDEQSATRRHLSSKRRHRPGAPPPPGGPDGPGDTHWTRQRRLAWPRSPGASRRTCWSRRGDLPSDALRRGRAGPPGVRGVQRRRVGDVVRPEIWRSCNSMSAGSKLRIWPARSRCVARAPRVRKEGGDDGGRGW